MQYKSVKAVNSKQKSSAFLLHDSVAYSGHNEVPEFYALEFQGMSINS